MSTAATLLTYGDTNRKEDVVLNAIEILTAEENSLLNMLGKTKAIDTVHHYQTDTLETAASGAVQMGADYTFGTLTTPSRLTNIVEEIAKPIRVSRPQEVVSHYSGENELSRQLNKALKNWGNSAEFDIVRSTLVSGISGTIAKMNGIITAISKSTNTTAHTSGTVFSASILDGLMADCWDNSNGDVATDLFVGSIMKRVIDSFTQKTNNLVNIGEVSRVVKTVTMYETSMGTLTIHKHRYVQQTTDATGRILGVRPDKLKLAYLDMPFVQNDLSKAGPYTPKAVYGSLTLEARNQDSNFFASGFLKSA
jgi:hypothetical protein